MSKVDICICTFRRAHIAETLRSLSFLAMKDFKVIVADNDDTPSARDMVEKAALEYGLSVHYVHAPARNISIARNACLDASAAPLVAFIDDDELVTQGWLEALLAIKADIVLGPVKALYAPNSPSWMCRGDFHSTNPVWVEDDIITGYTCNVLIARDAIGDLRFREELGRSGGEDTAFFAALHAKGKTIAFADDAVVTEDVPEHRAALMWLVKRRFRSGQTHALLLLENPRGSVLRMVFIAKMKANYCFLMMLVTLLQPVRWRFWLLRGVVHAGVVMRLLGIGAIEQYGRG